MLVVLLTEDFFHNCKDEEPGEDTAIPVPRLTTPAEEKKITNVNKASRKSVAINVGQ